MKKRLCKFSKKEDEMTSKRSLSRNRRHWNNNKCFSLLGMGFQCHSARMQRNKGQTVDSLTVSTPVERLTLCEADPWPGTLWSIFKEECNWHFYSTFLLQTGRNGALRNAVHLSLNNSQCLLNSHLKISGLHDNGNKSKSFRDACVSLLKAGHAAAD